MLSETLVINVTWLIAMTTCIFWTLCLDGAQANKCYRDEAIGEREGNIYHCTTDDLPRCCQENGEATCCIDETEKNVEEQLQLWGTVAGMLLLIALLFICLKTDISCCNNERSLADRWKNFRKNKSAESNKVDKMGEPVASGFYDNPIGGFSKDEDDDPDPYQETHGPPPPEPPVIGHKAKKARLRQEGHPASNLAK